jgi:hypothetical protein
MSAVKRTMVTLPDDLHKQLRQEATRRRMTISGLTQEAIETYLGSGRRRRLLAAGAGRSGRSDVSERIEESLRTGFELARRKPG